MQLFAAHTVVGMGHNGAHVRFTLEVMLLMYHVMQPMIAKAKSSLQASTEAGNVYSKLVKLLPQIQQ